MGKSLVFSRTLLYLSNIFYYYYLIYGLTYIYKNIQTRHLEHLCLRACIIEHHYINILGIVSNHLYFFRYPTESSLDMNLKPFEFGHLQMTSIQSKNHSKFLFLRFKLKSIFKISLFKIQIKKHFQN